MKNDNQPKHTQGEWKAEGNQIFTNLVGKTLIANMVDPYMIMQKGEQEANAQRIVKAVNMHDELISAIEKCMILINELPVSEGGEALYPVLQKLYKQAELK